MPDDNGVVDKVAVRITADISPFKQKLIEASDAVKQFNQTVLQTSATSKGGDILFQGTDGAARNLKQTMKELELQYKEGILTAQQYFEKLQALKTQFASALDVNTSSGMMNDQTLRGALLKAQNEMSKFNDFQLESDRRLALQHASIQAENERQTQLQLKRQQTAQADAIDLEMKRIKTFYDTKMTTASGALTQLEALMDRETVYFQENMDKQLQAMRMKYQLQSALAQQQQRGLFSKGAVRSTVNQMGGLGDTGRIIAGLAGFEAVSRIYETMLQGMKDVESGAAGIQQVFEGQIHSQEQLNAVTNQTIAIAQKNGAQINEELDAMKLVGRQYKDVSTALTLLNSATLLSVVDNVNLTDANRALEATMNSMGLSAKTQADAFANSSRIVDSWSSLAHNAAVSATQLMQAVEASGGAAHAVGINFDQLNAITTSFVRNTGMSGPNIGNALKSIFASIQTDKAEKALKTLDISLKQVGANGKEEFRPVFDVLLELSQKLQTTNDSQQKLLTTLAGGKFQWSKLASGLSDYGTIVDAYATSINSAGAASEYAQVQMNTLGRDITRLKDTFIEISAQTDQNGLGNFLRTIVEDVTNLIVGLEQMPPATGNVLMGIGGLLLGMKALAAVMNTLDPLSKLLIAGFQKFAPTMTAAAAATEVETVATGGLTAAFTALDVVSGGLAIVIGLVVAGLTASAISSGQATTATQQHTQALQDQIGVYQQQYNLALQKEQFMKTAIQQEQDLKKALDDHTLSAQQHSKVLQDMVDLYHAVGKATGDEAFQQVTASNANNQSLSAEQKAIAKLVDAKRVAYENAVKINNQAIQDDIATTNQKITDINAEIEALGKEQQAKMNELSWWQQATYDFKSVVGAIRGSLSFADHNASDKQADTKASHAGSDYLKKIHDDKLAKDKNEKAQLVSQKAQDEYKLASNKLDLLSVDTSGVGDIVPPKGSGGGGGSSGSGGTSGYTEPFKDLVQNNDAALYQYKQKVDDATASVQKYSDAMTMASTHLQGNALDTKALTNYLSANKSEISGLVGENKALANENAEIHRLLPQVQKDMAQVDAQHKAGKINAQQYREAMSPLQSEYQRLTSQLNQNTSAMSQNDAKMVQLGQDAKGTYSSFMQAGFDKALKVHQDGIDSVGRSLTLTNRQVSMYSREMSKAADNASMMKAYNNEVSALNKSTAEYKQQNKDLQDEIKTLNEQISITTQRYKQGKISLDEYNQIVDQARSTIDSDTQTINQNTDAIAANSDKVAQSTQTIHDKIVNELKTAYQDEYNMLTKQLDDAHTNRINQLNAEKDAIDAQLNSLQQLWSAQDAQAKLTDLQSQLAGVMADKSFRVVNTDGSVSYTYDQAKAADLQKQIADQQTQMARDAQKQQLEDQKSALEAQIKQVDDAYNTQKQQLDAFWQYKMQDDQINSDANNLILQNGLKGALDLVTTYSSNIIAKYNAMQAAAEAAGQALSQSMSGSAPVLPSGANDAPGYYDSPGSTSAGATGGGGGLHIGTMHYFKKGGLVPFGEGIPGVDSVPAMLSPGEIVAPSWDDLTRLVTSSTKSNQSITLNGVTLQFPNVKDQNDASGFVKEFVGGLKKYAR